MSELIIKSSVPLSASEQESLADMAIAMQLLYQERPAGEAPNGGEMGAEVIRTLAAHNIKTSNPDVYAVMIAAAAMLMLDSGHATITPIPTTTH